MKIILTMVTFVVSMKYSAGCINFKQNISFPKQDTLLRKERVSLLLDNGFSIPSFSVSGNIYLTEDSFIFSPQSYHGKRYEMYNDLVKNIVLHYDSILVVRKGSIVGGLLIKTKDKKYKFVFAETIRQAFHKNLRPTIKMIKKLKEERKK